MKKEEKGITLVALIITIIILLILAVVSIMAVTGTGLFSKTSDAVDKYENSREKEDFVIGNHIEMIGYVPNIKNNTTGNDTVGNNATGTSYYYNSGTRIMISIDNQTKDVVYYVPATSTSSSYYYLELGSIAGCSEETYNSSTTTLQHLPSSIKNGDKITILAADESYIIGDSMYIYDLSEDQILEYAKTAMNSTIETILNTAQPAY